MVSLLGRLVVIHSGDCVLDFEDILLADVFHHGVDLGVVVAFEDGNSAVECCGESGFVEVDLDHGVCVPVRGMRTLCLCEMTGDVNEA